MLFILTFGLYEKFLWRLAHKKNYFQGYWKGTVTYMVCERQSIHYDAPKIQVPHCFDVIFKIEQSPFKFEIVQGRTPRLMAKWEASNIEINPTDGFSFIYKLDSSTDVKSEYPPHIEGVEKLSVIRFKNGYPSRIKGFIKHLCLPGVSLYSGESLYNKITKEEAAEFFETI